MKVSAAANTAETPMRTTTTPSNPQSAAVTGPAPPSSAPAAPTSRPAPDRPYARARAGAGSRARAGAPARPQPARLPVLDMVVPEEVQDAVHEQEPELGRRILRVVPGGDRRRDHHVPELAQPVLGGFVVQPERENSRLA